MQHACVDPTLIPLGTGEVDWVFIGTASGYRRKHCRQRLSVLRYQFAAAAAAAAARRLY